MYTGKPSKLMASPIPDRKFFPDGTAALSVPRFGKSTVQLFLQLNLAAPADPMTGNRGRHQLVGQCDRLSPSLCRHTNPATALGRNLHHVVSARHQRPSDLVGYGYGLGTIGPNGGLNYEWRLGRWLDHQSSSSHRPGWPMSNLCSVISGHALLTNNGVVTNRAENKGFLLGWLSVFNAPDSIMTGDLNWVKKPWTNLYWPNGFTNHFSVAGSKFKAPKSGTRVINFTNFTGTFPTAP